MGGHIHFSGEGKVNLKILEVRPFFLNDLNTDNACRYLELFDDQKKVNFQEGGGQVLPFFPP